MIRILAAVTLPLILGSTPVWGQTDSEVWTVYWDETDGARRRTTAGRIATQAPYDTVYARLRIGRPYVANVPTGRRDLIRRDGDGTTFHYFIVVPESYDPARRYPVRVYLHGGIARPAWSEGGDWWTRYEELAARDVISVFPSSWESARWWEINQVDSLQDILTAIKYTYNVDENRVYLFGVSDGATGAYYHAFRAATPWAGFIALIGHPAVLNNPRLGVDGEMFITNLVNRPLFVANAVGDRLYPSRSMRPFIDLFRDIGVDVEFRTQSGGHSVRWWPNESPNIEAFIAARPRNPLPDRLSWETETVDRANRISWLVIDGIGETADRAGDLTPHPSDPFPHRGPRGRVDVRRDGNVIHAQTAGVTAFRVLISPDRFDLARPVRLIVNGTEVVDRLVVPSPATMLAWHQRDEDRTMLFAGEIAWRAAGPR